MAFMFAVRSKKNNACIIVEGENKFVSYGLESSPQFCNSSDIVIPAEVSAIVNCKTEVINGTLYLTSPPTREGYMSIICMSGIKTVCYFPKCDESDEVINNLKDAFIEIKKMENSLGWARDYFDSLDNT